MEDEKRFMLGKYNIPPSDTYTHVTFLVNVWEVVVGRRTSAYVSNVP